jgi:hypothetical protein
VILGRKVTVLLIFNTILERGHEMKTLIRNAFLVLCLGFFASLAWSTQGDRGDTESLARALAVLNGELDALKSANAEADTEMTQRKINSINTRLAVLEKGVAIIAKQGGVHQTTDLLLMKQELATLRQKADEQQLALQADMATVKRDQLTITGRVEALEKQGFGGQNSDWVPYVAMSFFVTCLLGIASWWYTSGINKTNKDAKSIAITSLKKNEQVLALANQAIAIAKRAESEIYDATIKMKDIESFVGFRKIIFPADFESSLKGMSSENPTYRFSVHFADSPKEEIALKVVWKGEGLVHLHGVKGQVNDVKIVSLKGVIGRAGRVATDGSHRLTGVKVDVVSA